MNPLADIYTELIAEESRNPEHRRHLDAPTCCERGHNPSCGDEITLELEVKDGVVADAAFTGSGCAISQASTSLMVGLIKGQPVEKAEHLAHLFQQMIKGEVTGEQELEELEDAMALQNISNMPARVKCAVLSWRTLAAALEKGNTSKNT
ncbi:MAG: SUF system NifU family Fe-S cluster assembly protein [Acidaminococcaceae bacterium]|nr:SUF system NifU family Fe-S cluster assembly protein [Acidaminococcaceae bacterium]MBQ9697305.1 SUF system NifU family Fe-S cluster assembly protein [Acidaminococcaceae bacterium]MBR1591157.1 SUF system NifU family Fe-S cluster assembly protein [Acidaminococcaceae bacterium]